MGSDDEPIAKAAYDELADHYAETVRTNAYNADLEFPATSSLIPVVEGKRVLDAGCGTGAYTAWLLDRGAEVVGVDASEAMLEYAVEETDGRAEFHRADLGEPLEFASANTFDGVVCALVLGYVEDLHQPFSEFARLLESDGFLVFSIGHPFDTFPFDGEDDGEANYFEVERVVKDWGVDVPYYRRPLSEILNPLLDAGFRLDTVVEPQPTDAFAEKRPERYEKESRYPVFLCARAER